MGTFRVAIGIGHPHGGDLRPVTALVDTGSTHSMMPESLLDTLRLAPHKNMRFRMADGNRVEYGIGEARFRIDDDELTCPVIFGPEGRYLLGATTLEIFSLMVDPTDPHPRLVPIEELYL